MLSGLARAFERGLRAAAAVLVLSLAGIVLCTQVENERFATTAYLAAMFAAVMLIALRCIPQSERLRADYTERSVAGSLAFWVVVGGALAASVKAAGNLGQEVLVGTACALAVVLAAVHPTGVVEWIRQYLSKGGGIVAIVRYAVVSAFAAYVLTAYVHTGETIGAVFGFSAFAIACTLELAPDRPIAEFVVGASVATAIAFAVAAILPSYAETAAAVGYTAAVFTMLLLVVRERYA